MVTSKLINGDSAEQLKKLDDNSVDLLCTDPPYGYGFMGKSWDKMLPPKEIFEESLRVLKPGSFAFVMSAPRSDVQFRMAQMLEDVGFEIGYTPIYWTYATGFPKAMNIGKMIDKRLGAKREVIGIKKRGDVEEAKKRGTTFTQAEANRNNKDIFGYGEEEITSGPASDEAKKLDGSYGGYQPKPAIEVVIVAMKPLSQKGYLDQSLDNQKGITWLDDCRIPFAGMNDKEQFDKDNVAGQMNFDGRYEKDSGKMYEGGWDKPMRKTTKRKPRAENTVFKKTGFKSENDTNAEPSPLGRFSANLLVSDDTLEEDFSRYYSLDAWWNSRLGKLPEGVRNTFPFLIVPKASKSEKNRGLEKLEKKQKIFNGQSDKSSTDMKGVEKKFTTQPTQNIHPTVKPLKLMSYLVTLGSRKGDVVLDPFMGSGTTPMACVTLDRKYVGIEREDEYFEISKLRVAELESPMKQWDKWL